MNRKGTPNNPINREGFPFQTYIVEGLYINDEGVEELFSQQIEAKSSEEAVRETINRLKPNNFIELPKVRRKE